MERRSFRERRKPDTIPLMRGVTLILCIMTVGGLMACHHRSHHEPGEVTVDVDATSDWVHTGVRVSEGQTLFFRCSGSWAVAPANERERWPDAGPDGHGNHPGERVHSKGDPRKELPGTPFGTLLGKVNGRVFPIGSQGSVIMPAAGILYLVINDYPFYRHDNRGRLQVSIARE